MADIVATPNLAAVLSCDAYILAGNFYGKKRRKRSDLINEEIHQRHGAQEEISPTKVTSPDLLIISYL